MRISTLVLTAWSIFFWEIGSSEVISKFSVFYRTWWFVDVFTRAWHWTIPRAVKPLMKINFNVILPYMPGSWKLCHSFWFCNVLLHVFPWICYIPCLPWFHYCFFLVSWVYIFSLALHSQMSSLCVLPIGWVVDFYKCKKDMRSYSFV